MGIVLALGVAIFVKDPRERGHTNSLTGIETRSVFLISRSLLPLLTTNSPTNTSIGKTQASAGVTTGDPAIGGGGGTWAELKKALQGCGEVLRSEAVRLLLLATALRFCAGFGIGTWAAPLLRANFLQHQGEFARINALIILVGGCASSVLGGILADKLARIDPRARLWVPALGCFLAIPLIGGTVFATSFHTGTNSQNFST